MRLGDLVKQMRDLAGHDQFEAAPRQQFSSGRELINAVKTRREEAQAFKALAQDVDAEIADGLDQYDPELIDGVRVLWIAQGKAARDETAFKHALKTGHRLRQQGQRLSDAAIIDAYEHAYNVAQTHGGAGRDSEIPLMRDRQTMARRVRGYVTQSKSKAYGSTSAPGKTTSSERKALATMGRRGGKKAAERWKSAGKQNREANTRGGGVRRSPKLISVVQRKDAAKRTGSLHTSTTLSLRQGSTRRWLMLHLSSQFQTGRCSVLFPGLESLFLQGEKRVTNHKQYTVPLPLGS